MTELPEMEFIGWNQIYSKCVVLSGKIRDDKAEFDVIVSISRGGHVISRILSDLLRLPIFNMSITSYKTLEQERLTITQKLNMRLDGKKVLLVDELVDTGLSMERATKYLRKIGCKSVKTAVMSIKPAAKIQPDYYVDMLNKWVIHPYEIRETYESLIKIAKRSNIGEGVVRQKMILAGVEERLIDEIADFTE